MVVKVPDVKIDAETLSQQTGNLTEDQNEAIALEAIKEAEGETDLTKKAEEKEIPEKGKEKSGEAPVKKDTEPTDEELLSAKDEELSDELKTRKAGLVETKKKEEEERIAEEDKLLAAKDEDLDEADKVKKAEIVKAREDAKTKGAEQEIADYAKENNISVDEARKDLEDSGKIHEKYSGNPKKLSMALLHSQRIYGKLSNDLKALKDAKPSEQTPEEVTVEGVMKWVEDGKLKTKGGKTVTKEGVIEAYREAFPDITEGVGDDAVFKLAAKDYKASVDKAVVEKRTEISSKAKEKRATIFDSLSEADKQYIPEIKPIIENLSDSQIMREDFSLKTYITYAKGQIFDATREKLEQEKKDFGAKEYNRGLEQAKILGIKRSPDGKPPKSKTVVLTDEQKTRAREMFDNPEISEERAYELYSEHLKDLKELEDKNK